MTYVIILACIALAWILYYTLIPFLGKKVCNSLDGIFALSIFLLAFFISNGFTYKPSIENTTVVIAPYADLIKYRDSSKTNREVIEYDVIGWIDEPLFEELTIEEETEKMVQSIIDTILSEKHLKVSRDTIREIVVKAMEYGNTHDVDPTLLLAIARYESSFNPNARAKTSTATGLMQVIARWHKEKVKGRDLTDIGVAMEVGAMVMAQCNQRAKGDHYKTLKCYRGMHDEKYFTNVNRYRQVLSVAMN